MLTTALVLATLITVGFAILFNKLPEPIKNFLSRRYIILDIIICWATFSMMGFAIVGLATAAMVSLFVSIWLYICNQKRQKAN